MAKLNVRRGRALMRLGRFTEANEAFSLILESTAGSVAGTLLRVTVVRVLEVEAGGGSWTFAILSI